MLALKGDSSRPSTTLRTGMVVSLSVLASVPALGRLARCCGVVGKPGGDLGERAADAAGGEEARGGVVGASGGGLAAAGAGDICAGLGGPGVTASVAGGLGGAALCTGGLGEVSGEGARSSSSSSTMTMVSWEARCCSSLTLATQWVSRVL